MGNNLLSSVSFKCGVGECNYLAYGSFQLKKY